MIIDKVKKCIIENELIGKGDKVLVAFSGGADSVCLLYSLHSISREMGFEVFAAHLNHGLRGEDAIHDENFAVEFCRNLGVELFVKKEDVRSYANENGIGEELAGRELRYKFFNTVMQERNISKLAAGHHSDDQSETMLMHFMRGSGIDGICGMRYKRDNIIRPLLDITKQQILTFCQEENLDFCTDATNFETEYSRNKVRLELLPRMSEFNSNLSGTLSRTAKILADEADFLEQMTETEYKKRVSGNCINIKDIKELHNAIKRRLIKKMIERAAGTSKDINYEYISATLELIEKKVTGKSINLLQGVTARIEYDNLVIEKNIKVNDFSYVINPGEVLKIEENGLTVKIEQSEKGEFYFPENSSIVIRTRQNGDRIYPLGMKGSKKLKDFFIDEKVPRNIRDSAILLMCDQDIAAVYYGDKVFYDRRFYDKNRANTKVLIF